MHKIIETLRIVCNQDKRFEEKFRQYQGYLLPNINNEPKNKLFDSLQVSRQPPIRCRL